eukprot:130124_1
MTSETLETPHKGHHTEDWSRSSYFDANSAMLFDLHSESEDVSSSDSEIEDFYDSNDLKTETMDTAINTQISDNPILNEMISFMVTRFDHLVETGELS